METLRNATDLIQDVTVTAVGAHVVRTVDGATKLEQLGRVETVMYHGQLTPPL